MSLYVEIKGYPIVCCHNRNRCEWLEEINFKGIDGPCGVDGPGSSGVVCSKFESESQLTATLYKKVLKPTVIE